MTYTLFERHRGEFVVSTDPRRLDLDAIHAWLVRSYWSAGIPRSVLERGIESSLCFGVYRGDRQVGFARMITDRATYAYLADVYIDEPHRGHGLGAWLVGAILEHPELQGLRRFSLVTRDAHSLYARLGFESLAHPERHMEIVRPAAELYGPPPESPA